MIDRREARTGSQFVLERFNTPRGTLGQSFDAAIVQILHVTNNLMSRSRALCKETKPDTLNVTAEEELSSYFVGHLFCRSSHYVNARLPTQQPRCRRAQCLQLRYRQIQLVS